MAQAKLAEQIVTAILFADKLCMQVIPFLFE